MKAAVKIEYIFPGVQLFRIICCSSYLFISNVQFFSSDMVQELNLSILNLEITLGLKQVYFEKHLKTCDLKSILRSFRVWKKLCTASLYWKINFLKQATYKIYVLGKLSKFVQVEDSLKIEKDLEHRFWTTFLIKFFDKKFSFFNFTKTGPCLGIWWRHDIWLPWLPQERKELSKWKRNCSLFCKCSFLYMQNKLAKMYRGQPLMDCSIDISSRLASDKEINKKPKWRISKKVTYISFVAPLIFFTDNK